MCLKTEIEKAIAQKAALDARIAKLQNLQAATVPLKNLLTELLADYSDEAPNDLPIVWQEVLAIGSKFNLSAQPLDAHKELKRWEALTSENVKLKQQLEEAQAEITDQDRAWGELSDERDDLEKELAELRSQMPTIRAEYELATGNDASELSEAQCQQQFEVWEKEAIRPALEKLYEEAQAEHKYESAEAYDTVEIILKSKGFFQPEDLTDYDFEEKHEIYRDWKIYLGIPNGGITAITLVEREKYAYLWDASTEYIQEVDPTFPESLADYDDIVKWTRALIDQVENLQAPGQLALDFSEPESEAVLTGAEYDAAVEEELALDDEEYETILITFQEQQWLVEVLNEFASYITILIQAKNRDEGFTAIVSMKDVEKSEFSLAKCAEQVLSERLTAQKQPEISAQPIAESANTETGTNFEAMGFTVQVFPQYAFAPADGGEGTLAGATFRFLNAEHTLVFDSSRTAAEIGDRTWKTCARDLIQDYRDKEAAKKKRIENPHKKPEDDFIELIKLNPSVGYLKQKVGADAGKIVATYVAFANKDNAGQKTATNAKRRAGLWRDHFHASFESFGWKVGDVRVVERMKAEQGKPGPSYEIKIVGVSIEQVQKLAEQDYSLLPGEAAAAPKTSSPAPQPQTQPSGNYRVIANGYEVASGTEVEMRSRFDTELKTFGEEGRVTMCLMLGQEIIEGHNTALFKFTEAQNFNPALPSYKVLHRPTQKTFEVWLRTQPPNGWANIMAPYKGGCTTKEAAAVDAVRRSLQVEKAE